MDWLKGSSLSKPNAWFFFTIFFIANTFLAYSSLTCLSKGWIFVFGLLLPSLFFLLIPPLQVKGDSFHREIFSKPFPIWIWITGIGTAVFLRFFNMTDHYLWPTGDEGLHGFLAIQLLHRWDWQFFYTVGEHPPLLIWLLSLFFKYFESPFFDLWFLPAFFSILVFPMGYFAARMHFSKSLASLFGILLAFGFWPLYSGRFCHQSLFIPFLELLSFFFASLWMKKKNQPPAIKWFLALGLTIGLGTLTFTSWMTVVLLLTLTIFLHCFGESLKPFFRYLVVLGAVLIPFIAAAVLEGYGRHLLDSSMINLNFSASHRLLTSLSYLSSIFWGSLLDGTSYGPVWGGMLNPLLGGAFFLGFLTLCTHWRQSMTRWLLLALLICFSPGLLAADYVEMNRIIQVMPLVLLVAAIGLQELALGIKTEKRRKLAIGCFLFFSCLLDLNHLFKPILEGPVFHLRFKKEIDDENFRAYGMLNKIRSEKGDGIILTNFLPLKYGHTLYVSIFHFNAAVNSKLDPKNAAWAAVATNADFEPFLSKRFPEARWYAVGQNISSLEGDMMIGIIPITTVNHATINHWMEVDNGFNQLQVDAEGSFNSEKTFRKSFQDLSNVYPMVQGDPFLESCYWEWAAQYYYSPSYTENVEALKRAVEKGYPASYLFNRMAAILSEQKKLPEAEEALRMGKKMKPVFSIGQDRLITLSR